MGCCTLAVVCSAVSLIIPAAGLQNSREATISDTGVATIAPKETEQPLQNNREATISDAGYAILSPRESGQAEGNDYPYSQSGSYEYPGEGAGNNVGGTGINDGGSYKIKNLKEGKWLNAALSWDGGGSHPMASVELDDPVAWKFAEVVGKPNTYTIKSQHPGKWMDAELSWDGGGSHPMASVEFDDHVEWKLEKVGPMEFRIKSQHPGQWLDAELSWDEKGKHPMASVEFDDPVTWKLEAT